MFWTQVRHFTRTIGFRLSFCYGVLFAAGALVLFGFIYVLLRSTLDRKDRELVEVRLQICASIYQYQGIASLREWLTVANEARRQKTYFHRVTDAAGGSLLLVVPEHWDATDLRLLPDPAPQRSDQVWERVARDEFLDISVVTGRLPDGATIQVARRTSSHSALLERTRRIFALVLAPTALVGMAIGAFATRRLTKPLRQLADVVREIINTGRLEVRVPIRRADDELQDLIVLFNRMIEGNEGVLRMMKETLDNVAHDVRTPLTRLRGIAESTLREKDLPEACAQPLEECIAETDRIQQLIQTLLEVARVESGVAEPRLERVDIAGVVEDAVGLYEHVAEEKGIDLRFAPQRDCHATVDPVRLRRAFANLLDNAVHYTPPGGAIQVNVECGGGDVTVRIEDTGVGISAEDLPRVWERLYRADKSRADCGLGLGLSLVKAIVEANGGRVSVQSTPGQGSEFMVTLPAEAAAGSFTATPQMAGRRGDDAPHLQSVRL